MHPCGAVGQRGAWEIDLTEVGGERYFFCNEQKKKVSRSPGRGDSISRIPFREWF